MCESIAYLLTENGEEKIMDNVVFALPSQDGIYLEDILGESKTVNGTIKEIRLLEHKILLNANA
jgi:predicted RNA-binding protein